MKKILPSKLQPLLFVIVFAVLGTGYLVASHAATPGLDYSAPGQLAFIVHDESGQSLQNVTITLVEQSSTVPSGTIAILTDTSCSPAQVTTHPFNNLLSYASTNCTMSSNLPIFVNGTTTFNQSTTFPVQIGTITDSGYSVSSNSFYHNGSTVAVPFNGGITIGIVMTKNAPAPAPSPTPAPPAPAPAAPSPPSSASSGNKSTGSSSGGSTKASSSTVKQALATSTPASTPTSTTTNPVSSDSSDSVSPSDDGSSSSTPNVPQGSSATLSSNDGLVSLLIPSGTFSTDAYCSIDNGSSKDLPAGSTSAVGPYNLDCTDSNGNALSPAKPIAVTITFPSNKSNYTAYVDGTAWQKTTSTNNDKSIKFNLVKAESFAAIQSKSRSLGSIILNIVGGFVLLLVLIFVIFLLRRRQQNEKYIDYDNYVNHNQPTPPPLQ